MAESYLNRIIKTGDTPTPSGYVRLAGVPDGESIIANAPIIENGGINYYPIYYMCLTDTVASESFTKTVSGVSTGADAYVFSDEPETLYVGDTTHTFDVSQDSETSEGWKCRYVIAYATEANKNDANGITINLYSYQTPFEFIGSQYLKLSSMSALFATNSASNKNLLYVNLSNSSFYNDEISLANFLSNCHALKTVSLPEVTTISGNYFCSSCYSLVSLSLPSVTTISGNYFCRYCYALENISLPSVITIRGHGFCGYCHALKTVSLPEVTTIGGQDFCHNCYELENISLPSVITINGYGFCYVCYSLNYFEIPNTITTLTSTTANTLNYTEFIKLPTDFDISACNFTGDTGYNKSLAWFTHLATQLKDNSGGTAKTMVIGAANIALIPTDTATIISNKNWTLS